MTSRVVPLTDAKARLLIPEDEAYEPEPGSVVLTDGLHGTAWQRYFSDGLWYSTTGDHEWTWQQMTRQRNLVLVYEAEPRAARSGQRSRGIRVLG